MFQKIEHLILRSILKKIPRVPAEEIWRLVLSGEDPGMYRYRKMLKMIPSNPRCRFCNAPFHGVGVHLMRQIGRTPSSLNPNFCRICLETTPPGGAEVELTMLFADVRGSTRLAEELSPSDFSQLINRFYRAATEVMIHSNALIDRLVGDQVIGLYLSGFAGREYARLAIEAAKDLLHVTGHDDPAGPWIPVGVGIHTDVAYVGKVGTEGVNDITVLGDAANVAARLSSLAGAGEIIISEETITHAAGRLNLDDSAIQRLNIKGKKEPVDVRILKINP